MLRLASSRFLLSPYATSSAVFSALSLPSATRRVLVLCVSSDQASTMVSFSSASFAESAERSAPSSIFFGSAYSYERGRGPCTVPPWRQRGERIEPTRARPVPFCRQSLRPAPLTSLLSLVLCVPARKPRRYHREASCSKCGFTLAPNTASASSTCPTFSPSRLTTSTTGIVLIPFSLTVLAVLFYFAPGARFAAEPPVFLAFFARRMKIYAPLGPGTEPRTNNKFSSLSTFTTFKFLAVKLALPM